VYLTIDEASHDFKRRPSNKFLSLTFMLFVVLEGGKREWLSCGL
jgi:hypothetical protein